MRRRRCLDCAGIEPSWGWGSECAPPSRETARRRLARRKPQPAADPRCSSGRQGQGGLLRQLPLRVLEPGEKGRPRRVQKSSVDASRRAPSTRPGARRPSPLSSPPAALRPGSSGRPRRVVGRARAHAPQVAVHWAADCLNIRTDPVSGTSAYEAYFGHKPDLTAICELGASVAALDDGADAPRVPLVAHDGVVVDVAVVVDSGQIVGQGACLARVVLAGGDDGGAAVLPPLVCSQSEPTQSCRPTEWQMAVVAFHR